jgi:uncharacterized membrane protein YhaH (DUF805 family)
MFNILWGDIQRGRLSRLQFLGALVLVSVLAGLLAFGVGAAIGAAERMAGGESLKTEVALSTSLGEVGVLALSALFALLLLAQLNILAKRLRDIGLPTPWLLVLGWLLLAGLLSPAAGGALVGLLTLLLLALLLVLPGGKAAR